MLLIVVIELLLMLRSCQEKTNNWIFSNISIFIKNVFFVVVVVKELPSFVYMYIKHDFL